MEARTTCNDARRTLLLRCCLNEFEMNAVRQLARQQKRSISELTRELLRREAERCAVMREERER